MSEFVLPLESVESHVWFDALPEIAQGYIQAAFFTGLEYSTGGGESVEIDGVGPANIAPGDRDSWVADVLRFWIENAETLAAAVDAPGGYSLEQSGIDFWFTRGRFGVGFRDRGLPPEIVDRLEAEAERAGEVSLFAEPRPEALREALEALEPGDPDSDALARSVAALAALEALEPGEHGEPLTRALEALESGADAETLAEALGADGWRVRLDRDPEPLNPLERAAADALEAGADPAQVSPAMRWRDGSESRDSVVSGLLRALSPGGSPVPALPDVGGRYGAPCGRRSGVLDPAEPMTPRRVTLDPGGYDSGGAYWGLGAPLWRVTGADTGESVFIRAAGAAAALEIARRGLPV